MCHTNDLSKSQVMQALCKSALLWGLVMLVSGVCMQRTYAGQMHAILLCDTVMDKPAGCACIFVVFELYSGCWGGAAHPDSGGKDARCGVRGEHARVPSVVIDGFPFVQVQNSWQVVRCCSCIAGICSLQRTLFQGLCWQIIHSQPESSNNEVCCRCAQDVGQSFGNL